MKNTDLNSTIFNIDNNENNTYEPSIDFDIGDDIMKDFLLIELKKFNVENLNLLRCEIPERYVINNSMKLYGQSERGSKKFMRIFENGAIEIILRSKTSIHVIL